MTWDPRELNLALQDHSVQRAILECPDNPGERENRAGLAEKVYPEPPDSKEIRAQ